MFIRTLAALKTSSKKREAEIQKEMFEMFKYVSDRGKKAGKQKIAKIKLFTSTLYLSTKITTDLDF